MQTKPEIILELEKELNVSFLKTNFNKLEINIISKTKYSLNSDNEIIYISILGSDLKVIPSSISKIYKLTYLYLTKNKIKDISILKYNKSLKNIYLSYNFIEEISVLQNLKIKNIDLRHNKIKILPEWICDLETNIIWDEYFDNNGINLYGNPIENVPIEIIKQGKQAIKQYFEDLKKDEEIELFESKMIIVGDGWVGKTCVLNRLIYDKYEEINSTEGIDIHKYKIETEKTTDFNINVWDFGGQEIYHNTHQFFLTKRSLYIFVWEARRDAVYRMAFGFWLNTIKMLSNDSPIIMVQNKIDERKMELNEADARKSFPNIVKFMNVSAKTGEGFAELKQLIKTTISQLPHVGNKLPKKWLIIRNQLEGLPKLEIARNTIDYNEYKEICYEKNTEPVKAAFLAKYYHDLGVFLHFHDNAILKSIVFLKPEWATEAVYRIFDDKILQTNKGKLEFSEFSRLWYDYPESQYVQLIELMQRFELCFQLPNMQTYIIPELIRANPPEFEWNFSNNLRFQYQYKFMPAGVLTRLIVLAHHLIDRDLYWKDGCVLRYNGCKARIEAEHYEGRINIWIAGNGKENLLSIIRYNFDYIHQNLKPTTAQEMIPCNCVFCSNTEQPHFWEYKDIKMMLEMNIEKDFCPQARKAGQLIQVTIKNLFGINENLKPKINLKDTILIALQQLQSSEKAIGIGKKEDNRNSFIANVLNNKGFIAFDQTLRGSSKSGKQAGEIDILIKNAENSDISIIEAMNLQHFDKQYIETHFLKLLNNYDRNGLPENYIIVYSDSENFVNLWEKYKNCIKNFNFDDNLQQNRIEDVTENLVILEIKLAKSFHLKHNREQIINHIFVNMNFNY